MSNWNEYAKSTLAAYEAKEAEKKRANKPVTEKHWISVEERLPEKNGVYLCASVMAVDTIVGIKWFLRDACAFSSEFLVTHWMELPAPPEVGK